MNKRVELASKYISLANKYIELYGSYTVVLMKVGEFYEVMGSDDDGSDDDESYIEWIARKMGISHVNIPIDERLTIHRSGFPVQSFRKYKNKLNAKGFNVIRVDNDIITEYLAEPTDYLSKKIEKLKYLVYDDPSHFNKKLAIDLLDQLNDVITSKDYVDPDVILSVEI